MTVMSFELQRGVVDDLTEIMFTLGSWQREGAPVQLHPGDLGWHWRWGARRVADELWIWRSNSAIAAIGFADGAGLLRMGIDPGLDDDTALAGRIVDDLSDPTHQVLPAGAAAVEARAGTALRAVLAERTWLPDDPWVPLSRELTEPVLIDDGLRVELVGRNSAQDWLEVIRSAFDSPAPPPDRWENLSGSPMLQQQLAQFLVGYDAKDRAVAAVAVWSAGPGRPGLLEPMGVDPGHRGHGHGRGITLAAAGAARAMGCSSLVLATPGERAPAVATYLSAGFTTDGPVTDFRRVT